MKKILPITIILTITLQVLAQTKVDSLFLKLGQIDNDTIKVDILNQIAKEYKINEPKKAFSFNEEAIKLAKKINYTNGLAKSYYILGYNFLSRGDHLNALDNFLKSLKLYKLEGDSINIGHTYIYIGNCYNLIKDMDNALVNYEKANDLFLSLKDTLGIIYSITNKGILCKELNQDSLALSYFEEALNLNKKINEIEGIAFILLHAGDIKLKNMDFIGAKDNYFKSLKIFKTLNDINNTAYLYNSLGNAYLKLNLCDSTIYYAKKSYKIGKEISSMYYEEKSLKLLSECYFKQNNINAAYQNLKKYTEIKDSILDQKLIDIVAEMRLKHQYENEKILQEFELAEKTRKLKTSRQKIYILAMAFIIMGLISWFIINKRSIKIKLFNKKIETQNNELINLAMYILQKNDLNTVFRGELVKIRKTLKVEENIKKIENLINSLIFKIALSKDIERFRDTLRNISEYFYTKLKSKYPTLTEREKQLAILLRLNFTSKQISVFLNQTRYSVDVNRFRLRKKMGLDSDNNLSEVLNKI